jgi:sarcosine oxidase subunit alpha
MQVDGIPNVRTCITPVRQGMDVQSQQKRGIKPNSDFFYSSKKKLTNQIAIVGAGPAGLSASIAAAEQGASVLLVDENPQLGGQLIKQTHRFFGSKEEKAGVRGIEIADLLFKNISTQKSIEMLLDTTIIGYYHPNKKHCLIAVKRKKGGENLLEINCNKIIFACGARENMFSFPGNDLPGVYGAGGVQTLMNVYGIKPGKHVVMVGAGNVGLIVSYQLLQAGVHVDRVVEAMPTIGGYHVHAAKIRRCGVPIYTSTTILNAYGTDKVEGATTIKLDDHWNPIAESEEKVLCDTICLSVGLTPSTELLVQTGAHMMFLPDAGGYVALHNNEMETTQKGIFVAGDLANIEEASTAMLEGKIAGMAAAESLGLKKGAKQKIKSYKQELNLLRKGPFGNIPHNAKTRIYQEYNDRYDL